MRILAVRPRALGDVVLITPALRALARGRPDATIEVATEPRYRALLDGLAGIAKVRDLERGTRGLMKLAAALGPPRVDLVVDFFGNPRTALLARVCGARRSAGFAMRRRAWLYDVRVPRSLATSRDSRMDREYAAAANVRLAEAVGGVRDGLETRVARSPDAARVARALLEQAGISGARPPVGLLAAGTWPTKTWPAASSGLLARELVASGREVLLLAGPGEDAVTGTVRRLEPRVRVLPPCDVGALVSVIGMLSAVVGTDSGPKHVAAALGVPTFTWYGPTHPATWSPPGDIHGRWWTPLPCRACDLTSCPHWNCMPGLTPERAARLVLDHLERHERSAADLRAAAGA